MSLYRLLPCARSKGFPNSVAFRDQAVQLVSRLAR
jgi:hypothetical protein